MEKQEFRCKVFKVQKIFYLDMEDNLQVQYAKFGRRQSKVEAREILDEMGIEYTEILNIKPKTLEFNLELEDLEKYIKE